MSKPKSGTTSIDQSLAKRVNFEFGSVLDREINSFLKKNLEEDALDVISCMCAALVARHMGLAMSACDALSLEGLKESTSKMVESLFDTVSASIAESEDSRMEKEMAP